MPPPCLVFEGLPAWFNLMIARRWLRICIGTWLGTAPGDPICVFAATPHHQPQSLFIVTSTSAFSSEAKCCLKPARRGHIAGTAKKHLGSWCQMFCTVWARVLFSDRYMGCMRILMLASAWAEDLASAIAEKTWGLKCLGYCCSVNERFQPHGLDISWCVILTAILFEAHRGVLVIAGPIERCGFVASTCLSNKRELQRLDIGGPCVKVDNRDYWWDFPLHIRNPKTPQPSPHYIKFAKPSFNFTVDRSWSFQLGPRFFTLQICITLKGASFF